MLVLLSGARALAIASEPASGAQMDFVAYWAAARLLLNEENPYVPSRVLEVQQKAGLQDTEPLVMWNPPWAFAVTLPFGLLPYWLSQLLWLAVSIASVLFSAKTLWRIYTASDKYSRAPWLLALTFFPTILVLLFGQMSPLVLLGLTAFVVLERRQQRFAAGAVLVIVAVKPHFVYLFWIVLALWIWHQAKWPVLYGALLTGLTFAGLPLLFDPAVYSHFLELYRTASVSLPLDLPAPTLRNAVKILLSIDSRMVEYLSTMIGIVWALLYWHRQKSHWSWEQSLPLILLVSFVTAAYTWTFDQVVLLPAIIQGAAWMRERTLPWYGTAAAVLYGIADFSYLALKFRIASDLYYFWLAPTLLMAYLILKHAYWTSFGIGGTRQIHRPES